MFMRQMVIAVGSRSNTLLLRCAKWLVMGAVIVGCGQAVASVAAPPSRSEAAVTAVNLSRGSLQQVPMTFGEPFRAGDIPEGNTIIAYMGSTALPTQADIKARNPDGSIRHAILTVLLPSLADGAAERLSLRPSVGAGAKGPSLTLDDLLHSSFNATVDIQIAGQSWHLDARALLQRAATARSCKPYGRDCNQWLSGPLTSEWVVGGPVLDAQRRPNSHLAVYFAVRAYGPPPVSHVRVDVTVENDWAYADDPQNVTYDAKIIGNGHVVYTIDGLEHYRQARWHKVFWWGKSDPVYAMQDSRYLQATLAVPRYEDIKISQQVLQKAMQHVAQDCGPMQSCDQTEQMSTAGAQSAIGPLPRWTSAYVIDPTYQAYKWMLANSDALGSYAAHYRDQATGEPVSVEDHPCATIVRAAEISRCPVAPHANDNFPRCTSQCKSPLEPNIAHHPSPAYVAYLVTGDWYYLTELKFWADWVVVMQNPTYRDYRTGLVNRGNPRGQAWALRTLGFAAYGLPDDDPLKKHLNGAVESTIGWYNKEYTDNPSANALHIITWDALSYPNNGNLQTGIAIWQDSFFTWSAGNLKDLGFAGADRLLDWVSAFQINLMTNPDYCWVLASEYELQVRDTKDSPFYDSWREVYAKNYPEMQGVACASDKMAALISKRRPGEPRYSAGAMTGYPASPVGFPANFQIGLAAAADSDVPNASRAWAIFANRSSKPDYSTAPQFAVIPRGTAKGRPH